MGVHGLWDLLAPVGRRVSVETLAGKKLAIDASIWMVQFMKAMRDDKGEMVRNAHLLGFFRRICKLLFLRTKPVFVFDGGTPALKRRTVIARRRQRENAQAKIRKTAEKLLLNQLKAMRLKELAMDLENQREMNSDNVVHKKGLKGKKAVSNLADRLISKQGEDNLISESCQNLEANKMSSENNASTSAAFAAAVDEDSEGEEEVILPARGSNVDPTVLAALPPSLQRDLLLIGRSVMEDRDHLAGEDSGSQNEKDKKKLKGKEILSDLTNGAKCNLEVDDVLADTQNQQKLDEMLAASLAAEEDENLSKNAARSDAPIISDAEVGDEDEEMILPVHGKVDPSILAALPPSVQLDLLVQMRERLMAENRQRYQKVKKAPEKFSELQIEAYLKTVAFRREIDEVQKAASGKVVDGVQTSRIASEANREFIFSTSFAGDKQSLASSGPAQKNGDKPRRIAGQLSFKSMDSVASFPRSNSGTELCSDEPGVGFDEGVETYLDERGRTRVSRVRAMGMRMTRDLQRNLDLMKEIEQELTPAVKTTTRALPSEKQHFELSGNENDTSVSLDSLHEQSMLNVGTSVQISFEVDDSKCSMSDDDMFTCLVSGKHVELSFDENKMKNRRLSGSASDSDWEEGVFDGKDEKSLENVVEVNSSLKAGNASDDSEVEWEEGGYDDGKSPFCLAQSEKPVSKGDLEEDADLQEAIRRSLKDLEDRKCSHPLFQHEKGETSAAKGSGCTARFLHQGNNASGQNKSREGSVHDQMPSKALAEEKPEDVGWTETIGMATEKSFNIQFHSSCSQLGEDAIKGRSLDVEAPCTSSATNLVRESIPFVAEQSSGSYINKEGTGASLVIGSGDNLSSGLFSSGLSSELVNGSRSGTGAEPSKLVVEDEISVNELTYTAKTSNRSICIPDSSRVGATDGEPASQRLSSIGNLNNESGERGHFVENSSMMYEGSTEANTKHMELEEEMLLLRKEYENLGEEQRKLERNADSVSGEMFAECQELLQMFGLPYIIAPMEAEAQCAYMEIAGLVDGVVTDDSDVFLFGSQNVYKNIFDDRKYVETYFMKDIEKELGLSREKLIRMALLLGSDYTEGISGVGIVNAIEIVNAFSEEDGLKMFREWIESPDPSILGEIGAPNGTNARKRSSKLGDHRSKNSSSLEFHGKEQSMHDVDEIKQIFMDKHRNVSKNWHIPASFPSEAVISAYTSPQVDKSTEPFSWGKPDLHVLQRLCWEKFGWDIQKSNELLLPVLKEYNKHETQLRLEAFYTFNERFAKIRSKRIKQAVKSITKHQSIELTDDAMEEVSNSRKKRKDSNVKSDGNRPKRPSKSGKETSSSNKNYSSRKSASAQARIKKADIQISTEETEWQERAGCTEPTQKWSGRARDSGEQGRTKGGKRKRSLSSRQFDSSFNSDHEGHDGEEPCVESSAHFQELRRSTRRRKSANYVENDLENHDVEPVDLGNKGPDEKVAEQEFSSLAVESSATGDLSENVQHEQQHSVQKSSEYNNESQAAVSADEGETAQPDPCFPTEVDAFKDYLKMGGGFCLDEAETKVDDDTSNSLPDATPNFCNSRPVGLSDEAEADAGPVQGTSSTSRTSNEVHGWDTNDFDSEKSLELAGASHTEDASDVIVSLPETNRKSESSNARALTAMPFLKRKRRKQ